MLNDNRDFTRIVKLYTSTNGAG